MRGTFNNSQENACIHVSTFFYLADCSYEKSHAEIDGHPLPWVGPTVNPVYYLPGSPHAVPAYRPVPGDDRIAPALEATLSIDDHGTADPADDTISGVLIVGPAARNVVSNINSMAGRPPRVVESWTSITHTLAPTVVDSATRNALGGFDYVIASRGFPDPICRAADAHDCYTSAYAPRTTDGPKGAGVWSGPGNVGVGRDPYLGGNLGATTTATMTGYVCADDAGGKECAAANVVWGSSKAKPDLSNLLLKVSTDARRRVTRATGFWTHEYRINAGPDSFQLPEGRNNSWQGGYLQLEAGAGLPPK